MSRRLAALAVLLGVLVATVAAAERRIVPPTADALARDVYALTAPGMDGRASGTPGADAAARLLAGWLAATGLAPGGEDGTFFQSFVFSTGTVLAPGNRLDVMPPASIALRVGSDWQPHGGSLDGEVEGPVVFVGHGVQLEAWNDYDGVDVRKKLVMILDGVPDGLRGQVMTRAEKLVIARRHGAAGALVVADRLPSLETTAAVVPLRSASLTRSAAERLLRSAGRTLADLETEIASQGRPASRVLPLEVRMRVALGREERRAVNVIGVLPGTDAGGQAVVVGAHHDHVGVIDGQVHPGADDNASGTAVVVNLARAFATGPPLPRTLVFAFFGAEEVGLLGARHYVGHPTVPLERTVAMINLDMVGRLRERLTVGGVGSSPGFGDLVREAARGTGVPVRLEEAPWAPSDHLRFYRAGIPVLFLTTGTHEDYHRPTDLPERLSIDGIVRISALAARLIQALADTPRPAFVQLSPPRRDTKKGGPLFGIVADPHVRDGVRLAEVLPDSAAHHAGLRPGDVILRFGGHGVDTFETLRRAISDRAPGTTVEVVYLRDGEPRAVRATLGAGG